MQDSRAARALEADRDRGRVRQHAPRRCCAATSARSSPTIPRSPARPRSPSSARTSRWRSTASTCARPGAAEAPTTDGAIFTEDRQPQPPDIPDPKTGPGLPSLHALPERHGHPLPARARRGQRLRADLPRGAALLRPDAAGCRRAAAHHPGLRRARHQLPALRRAAPTATSPSKVAFDVARRATRHRDHAQADRAPDLAALGTEPADGGGAGLTAFVWRLRRPGSVDEAELDARAPRGRANELSHARHAPRASSTARSTATCCCRACRSRVDGVGDRIGGIYYVDAVSHTVHRRRLPAELHAAAQRLRRQPAGEAPARACLARTRFDVEETS